MNNSMGFEIKFIFTIIVTLSILTDFAFAVWNKYLSGRKKLIKQVFDGN
jgi:hypothetical protein